MKKTNPQKILFVLPALTAGGAERVMITLMNGIDRTKFTPCFLTISNKGELKDLIDPQIPFNSLGLNGIKFCLPRLFIFLRKERPDIIVSTMAHMNFAVLMMKPLFPNTKFVVREAITPSFLFKKYKNTAFIIKALYKWLYPKAHIVLSPSQIIFDEFRDILRMSSTNFYMLPNPVSDIDIETATPDHIITSERHKTVHVLAAGRLGKQKGFDRLIEYLPQMTHKYNWTLTIIGEGDERSTLEALVKKHGFEDKINLPGLVRPPWTHYMNADCFLMPSRFEGLPNVVLESLACGTPAIATKESGGIQYIADNSPKGAVTIVSNMVDFVEKMENVKPAPSKKRKKSLLNNLFSPESVFSDFSNLLEK
jgi:glycosyltransferase involved in cell wall biosynthesis